MDPPPNHESACRCSAIASALVGHIERTDADRIEERGVGVHALRETTLTNALENGAPIQKVQQLAGHSDIPTTQLYYRPSSKDTEDAARHVQIR